MQTNYKLKLYQFSYCLLFLLALFSVYVPIDLSIWIVIVTFAFASVVFDIRPIVLPSGDNLSLVSPLIFTAGVLYGTSTIFLINMLSCIALLYLLPKKWIFHLFNCAQYSLSGVIGFWFYHQLESTSTSFISNLPSFFAFSFAFFLSNVFFITTYLKLSSKKPYKELLTLFFEKKAILIYFTMMALGILMATVVRSEGLSGFIIFFAILCCLSISYRSYYKMFEHFRSLSEKDELTRLYNHRYFQETLTNTVKHYNQVALFMIDLDYFKVYNDTFGHPKGDKLLCELATILKTNLPSSATACRYGGEEFTVILPNVKKEEALLIAESLRKTIASHPFEGREQMPQKCITISIGVSTYPDMATSREQLIMLADQALYKSKFSSRNKVQLYSSVIDELKENFQFNKDEEEIIKTLKTFLTIINSKDRYTFAHTERIMEYAEQLAKKIGLPDEKVQMIRYGALLHDIGKVEVPTEVLNKTSKLEKEEWETIKKHVIWGEQMVSSIKELSYCIPMIRHHHERYDGKGYPDQLLKDEIPIEARIITIVDCFDAMTTNRPYQKAKTIQQAIDEIVRCSGTQFDPLLIQPFIEVIRELRPELQLYYYTDFTTSNYLLEEAK